MPINNSLNRQYLKNKEMFTSNVSINKNNNDELNQYFNNHIERNKSITDFWKLRYDQNKENERLYLIKRQNLTEVKMLIDKSVKLFNKARQNVYDYEKSLKIEENKNMIKSENKKKREKAIMDKEKMEEEMNLVTKRNNERDFNKAYIEQLKLEEKKEQKILEHQNELMKSQKDWEMKNFEHKDKVENLYRMKHELIIKEYLDTLKKDIIRNRKLNQIREEFDIKNKIEDERRDRYLINFKHISHQVENLIGKKFEKRQKHISDFVQIQKKLKSDDINIKKQKRIEKMQKNEYMRQLNEQQKSERRKKLIEQFEINEEKVKKRKDIKEKIHEDKKQINHIKFDSVLANFMEIKNLLLYKNLIKVKKMQEKDREIEEKIKRRKLSAVLKLERQNELKVKKDLMINNVKKIMDERKEHKLEDVYKRVFSDEEMKFVNDSIV